jgi:hypothetical protein
MNRALFATLAIEHARKLVKEEIRKLGGSAELTTWAMAYLEAHRDYLEEHAMEVIERSPELRKLYYKHFH